jgi:hypothetical protein
MPSDSIEFYGELDLTIVSFPVKLEEEVQEVITELDRAWNDEFTTSALERLAEEVLDVMQVCYTFLKTHFSEDEIDVLNTLHLFKLRNRHDIGGTDAESN